MNAPQLLPPPLSFSVRQNSRHVGYVGRNEQHGSHIGLVSLRDMRLEQHIVLHHLLALILPELGHCLDFLHQVFDEGQWVIID
ncbi:MAG: hypothetical protein ACK55Z_34995, partial [bacterium]